LACGEAAAIEWMPKFGQHPPDLRGQHVGGVQQLVLDAEPLGAWRAEDAVAIAVDGGGNATAGDYLAQQQQVASAVFLVAEHRSHRVAGGVVDGTQQAPARTSRAEPAVR